MAVTAPLPQRKLPFYCSLHFKLLMPLVALGAILAWSGAFFLHIDSTRKQRQEITQRVELIAHSIDHAATSVDDPVELRRFIEALGGQPEIRLLAVAAGQPPRIVASSRTEWQDLPLECLPATHAAALLGQVMTNGTDILHFFNEERELHYAHALPLPAGKDAALEGPAAVALFYDAEPLRAALEHEAGYLAVWLAGMLGLLSLIAYLLFQRYVMQPIGKITRALRKMDQRECAVRLPSLPNDELGFLALTLNHSVKRIEYLAYYDQLTGLPNRALFLDRLRQAMSQAARNRDKVALLFLDLDHFKTVNDGLGHGIGDLLLAAAGDRLSQALRGSDTVCRQGGDEFLIVLPGVADAGTAAGIAEKILERFGEGFHLEGQHLRVTPSIGVSLYPDDGEDFETLLKNADKALYSAKAEGRNAFRFFSQAMDDDAHERLRLHNLLHKALENREFFLLYQPQVELLGGQILGVEALLRWHNPELGLVSPSRFIPVAESNGLIVPIGAWVLREACRQAAAWRRAGLPELTVAVNISALQMQRDDFPEQVGRILQETGLPASCLELELTESVLVQDNGATRETLRRLKSLGVQLSIDDFGTGYSSLAYLKRLAVDKLKIDQSFVRDFTTNTESAAIVRAIVQMAHSLSLSTIAEGVEQSVESELLLGIGCREAQGYHFGKPMPPEEIEVLFAPTPVCEG